jgi:hypothetical protein
MVPSLLTGMSKPQRHFELAQLQPVFPRLLVGARRGRMSCTGQSVLTLGERVVKWVPNWYKGKTEGARKMATSSFPTRRSRGPGPKPKRLSELELRSPIVEVDCEIKTHQVHVMPPVVVSMRRILFVLFVHSIKLTLTRETSDSQTGCGVRWGPILVAVTGYGMQPRQVRSEIMDQSS